MNKHVGILTAGGDSPGLNAAIRGIGKSAIRSNEMDIIGFRDGFRGLMENRIMRLDQFKSHRSTNTVRLSQELEEMTGLESRLTILGHLQRGGTPSAADRILATRLGSSCVQYIQEGVSGAMIAVKGQGTEAIPLEQVVGQRSVVPLDHSWLQSARRVGTCLGD